MEVALAAWLGAGMVASVSAGCLFFGKSGPPVKEPAAQAPRHPAAAAAAAAAAAGGAAAELPAAEKAQSRTGPAQAAVINAAAVPTDPVAEAEWRRHSSGGSGTSSLTPVSGEWALQARGGGRDVYSLIQQHALELGPLLGTGNFGRVYQGTWEGRPVAIKVVPHGWATAAKMASEMELCTKLEHRHVVKAHFHFTVETRTQTIVPVSALLKHAPKQQQQQLPSGSVVPLIRTQSTPGSTEGSFVGPTASATPDAHYAQNALYSGVYTSTGSLVPLSEEVANSAGEMMLESGALFADDDDPDVLQSVVVQQKCDRGSLAHALAKSDMFKTDKGVVNMHAILLRARDVAIGLQYLHGRSVCHGDLKGENVLLNSDALDPYGVIALLADFGMSQVLQEGKSHKTTRSMGTVAYMSPETLLKGEVYPSTDVYSYGILLWELFHCKSPYEGLNTGEIMHSVLVRNSRPVFTNSVPVEYKALAEDCWQMDRHKRPTIDQVVARMEALLGKCKQLQAEMEETALGLSGYL